MSVDFQPHGNDYFFIRLEAVAGEPIDVEVRDQDGSEVVGIYRVSVGEPLAIFKEQATNTLFLPLVRR